MKKIIFFVLMIAGCLFAVKEARADGLIIIPRPPEPFVHHPPTPFPLEVKYHRVEVNIDGQIAETRIDQEFYNPSSMRLEGFYIFPLPKGAVFSNFSMSINGKMVSAELLDAKKAGKIYEDIVRKMRDPALLEYSGTGAFKVRIYPIEPNSYKRVKISYTEVLKTDSGMTAYTYPLNTEKFSAKPLKDVSIRINLKSKRKIKTIFCPTHEVEIKRDGEYRAVVGFEDRNVKPDTDFTLYYGTDKSEIGLNILTHRIPDGKDGFFFLAVTPSFSAGGENIVPKDITFVVDTSGSMAGEKMNQAKKSLIFCLENLNSRDRFEIIRFSTETETLFGKLVSSTQENLKEAKQFVENMKPIGGTNIEEALETSLKVNSSGNSDRPAIIIFITDGKPTIGTTDENLLVKKVQQANSSNTRIFTFGIGNAINTHLLDRITEETKAYRTYVQPDEDIELKISGFYEKIKSPVLVNLQLSFDKNVNIFKVYPKELPDIFKGSQLIIFGRYSGSGKTTGILKGTMEGKQKTFYYTVNFPAENGKNEFIAPLWAAQRIGYLLDQIRLNGEDKELKDEIITLARQYGIVTPYTSYLIVEDEKIRNARRQLPEEHSTLSPSSKIDASFGRKLKNEFDSMYHKSGSAGVTASEEVQELKNVRNYKQIYQGQARLNYIDKEGNTQNLASQVKNIQGRAVYQTGKFWVDSKIQTLKNQKTKRIQFASSEFFTLMEKEPASAQFMALGQNIRFALNNTIYEIFE